jgi:phosphate transport system protein
LSLRHRKLEVLVIELNRMTQRLKSAVYTTQRLIETSELEERRRLWSEIENTAVLLDELRGQFINGVLLFIAQEQPLGRDLLVSHILLSIAYDALRISRYCREIARIDSMLAPTSGLNNLVSLSHTFKKAIEAVEAALHDLEEFNTRRKNIVEEIDRYIDEVYKTTLLEVASSNTVQRELALKALLMRHIERIVDHAQYIEQYLEKLVE